MAPLCVVLAGGLLWGTVFGTNSPPCPVEFLDWGPHPSTNPPGKCIRNEAKTARDDGGTRRKANIQTAPFGHQLKASQGPCLPKDDQIHRFKPLIFWLLPKTADGPSWSLEVFPMLSSVILGDLWSRPTKPHGPMFFFTARRLLPASTSSTAIAAASSASAAAAAPSCPNIQCPIKMDTVVTRPKVNH